MTWFIEGGWTMYLILGTDVLLGGGLGLVFLIAVVSRFANALLWPARILAVLALLATVLPVLEGAFGWWSGLQLMYAALEHASPEYADALEAQGRAIAILPFWFGLGSTILLGLGALVSLAIAAIPGRPAAD